MKRLIPLLLAVGLFVPTTAAFAGDAACCKTQAACCQPAQECCTSTQAEVTSSEVFLSAENTEAVASVGEVAQTQATAATVKFELEADAPNGTDCCAEGQTCCGEGADCCSTR